MPKIIGSKESKPTLIQRWILGEIVERMVIFRSSILVFFVFVMIQSVAFGQSVSTLKLNKIVSELNHEEKYKESFELLQKALDAPNLSAEDRVFLHIYISDTYKRTFDYPNVIKQLNTAKEISNTSEQKREFLQAQVNFHLALAFFDIKEYDQAAELMALIRKRNFKYLSQNNQAFIVMQEAYLAYLEGDYKPSERLYDEAIQKMLNSDPKDLPIVYGKKISLYAKMDLPQKMDESYDKAVHYAKLYGILKYQLYAAEMMRNAFKEMNDYQKCVEFFDRYDSLQTVYNADENKQKLKQIEIKFETERKERELKLQKAQLTSSNRLVIILIALSLLLILGFLVIYGIQRRKKLVVERNMSIRFTKTMLTRVEEEKKRISSDLHDSVNSELLLIKSAVLKNDPNIPERVDTVINMIRGISRNLHPVMFDELGLVNSIEQLVYQVGEFNQFILSSELDYQNGLYPKSELQLFRIIQEAVTNIIKYSNAVAGQIRLQQKEQSLEVIIQDNGNGFDVNNALVDSKSFGLLNMIERTRLMNGNFDIQSNAKGTIITLILPLENKVKHD